MENTSDNYFSRPPENFSGMENAMPENPVDPFPPKPVLEKNEGFISGLLFSLALFVLAYYVFFDKDIMKMAILVVVLLIHELGHFLAMKYFRYTEVKMFFIPLLGALVTGEKKEISQRQRSIILLAGPVPGIIIGAVLFFIGTKTGNRELLSTSAIFIYLNAANLLPLTPLDGGKLVETLFFHSQTMLRNIFTLVSAAVVTVIAIKFEMYTLLIIPFFMMSAFMNSRSVKKIKDRLTAQGIDYTKPFEDLTNREYWLMREQVITDTAGFRNIDAKLYQTDPRERQIAQRMRSFIERHPIPDLSTGGIILFTLIWLVFLGAPSVAAGIALYSRM